MDPDRLLNIPKEELPRFELIEDGIKTESNSNSPKLHAAEPAPPATKSPSQPVPSTEAADTNTMAPTKKKGTASAVKKAPKRPKGPGAKKTAKKPKTDAASVADEDGGSEEDESDNGPYCLCRGPDDHRWMICCEKCEDWFHGECIKMDKGIGESLIEKFICPNCSTGSLGTIYKKTCALGGCKKAARLSQTQPSVFCSVEHTQMWWERMLSRLPKAKAKADLSDHLTQDEFMALLSSGLAAADSDGVWKLAKAPFAADLTDQGGENGAASEHKLSGLLTEEERRLLDKAADARFQLADETLLCHKMISLIELAQERRRAAITAGRFGEDVCGYDQRLDTISARDAFAAYIKTPDGAAIFEAAKLGDPFGAGDEARGMCERKRCKAHGGWQKILVLGIKHQIREMAGQVAEIAEEERIVRDAAAERSRRKTAEANWVEVIDG